MKNFEKKETNLNLLIEKLGKLNTSYSQYDFDNNPIERERNLIKSLIEENSGKILSNVSKKLDYLVAGEKPTVKKVKSAKELNISVITQDEWIKMLEKH